MQTLFYLWLLSEQVPSPRKCERGRLMTCQEESYHLIAELLVRHNAAFFVSGLQEEREQTLQAADVLFNCFSSTGY